MSSVARLVHDLIIVKTIYFGANTSKQHLGFVQSFMFENIFQQLSLCLAVVNPRKLNAS